MNWIRKIILIFLCFGLVPSFLTSLEKDENQNEPYITRVVLNTGMGFPAGDTADMYANSYTGEFFVQKQLPQFPLMDLFLNTGYSFVPLLADRSELSLLSVGAGVYIDIEAFHRFHVMGRVWGGYYMGLLHADSSRGGSAFISESVDLGYDITPSLRLTIGGAYRNFMDLHSDFTVWAGAAWKFGAALENPYMSSTVITEPVYPDLRNYYNAGNPVARFSHGNNGDDELVRYRLFLDVPGILDEKIFSLEDSSLDAGAWTEQPVFVRFSGALDENQGVLEGRLVSEYKYKGWPLESGEETVIEVRSRVDWNDPASFGLFVSSKNQTVTGKSNTLERLIENQTLARFEDPLLKAVGLFQDLKISGVRYVEDGGTPRSWVEDSSGNIPFPAETLESGAGNRLSLALLYLAELESLGVPTGLIHADGTVLAAVKLDFSPQEGEDEYSSPQDIFWFEESPWLTIDMAQLEKGFTAAVRGASEIMRGSDKTGFISTDTAWSLYPQTGYSGDPVEYTSADPDYLRNDYLQEIRTLTEWKIEKFRHNYLNRIEDEPDDVEARNNLGVLLSKYELYGEAMEQYVRILLLEERMETLVNAANIHYLQGDLRRAMTFYERAGRVDPYNPYVLLGLVRVNFELKNYGDTRDAFSRLETVDPELASEFAIMKEQGDEAQEEARRLNLHRRIFWLEVEEW